MKLISYNILDGGRDGQDGSRLERVLGLLQRERPELLLLSECCGFERDHERELHRFERALGMSGLLATADSGYHLALFWRGDALLHEAEVLRVGFAHVALRARLTLNGRACKLLGAHLNPASGEARLREAQRLAGQVRPYEPALLLGDLNAVSPRDAAGAHPERWPQRYRERHLRPDGTLDTRAVAALEAAGLIDLDAALHAAHTQPTWPARRFAADRPRQRLDYALASAPLARRASACAPLQDDDAQQASDHLPLCLELQL